MTSTPFRRERDVAIEAAVEAARLIRYHAGRLQQGEIADKGTHDLVTHVDEGAQRLIIERLNAAFPAYDVLAEEGGAPTPQASTHACRWVIDPIDGTTNFTRGVAPFGVSIGLECEGELVVGVVLDVPRDELFTAIRGDGLFVNGRPARVSTTSRLEESVLTTGFPYRSFGHVDAYLTAMRTLMSRTHGIRRPGSASLDFAAVACGRYDGFFETGLHPWDIAAGIVLVREGGGMVTDYRGKEPDLFGMAIVAGNARFHDSLLEALAPLAEVVPPYSN